MASNQYEDTYEDSVKYQSYKGDVSGLEDPYENYVQMDRPESESSPDLEKAQPTETTNKSLVKKKFEEIVNTKCIGIAFIIQTIIFIILFAALFGMYATIWNKTSGLPDQEVKMLQKLINATGWIVASDKLLYRRFESEKNYPEATKVCESHGGRLLAKGLRSLNISRQLLDAGIIAINTLVGYIKSEEGTWEWIDGKNSSGLTVEWETEKPKSTNNCRCAKIVNISKFPLKLKKICCEMINEFVCEL